MKLAKIYYGNFLKIMSNNVLLKLFTGTVSQHRKFYLIITVFYHYIFYYSFLFQLVAKEPL